MYASITLPTFYVGLGNLYWSYSLILFSELMAGIQVAAEQAAHTLAHENLRILKSYFVAKDGDTKGDAGAEPAGDKHEELSPSVFAQLVPLTVELTYPIITAEGVSEHQVFVPLISLAPIVNLQLSTIDIEMDLEVMEKEGDVMVGFPQHKTSFLFGEKVTAAKPNAKIKITINSGGRTPGVTALIEGYDKALRAQIPG